LLWDFYAGLGLRQVDLLVNTMGTTEDRQEYTRRLQHFLVEHLDELADDDREKVEAHPLRVLDSKRTASRRVAEQAPKVLDALSPAAQQHFERVQAGLEALGIPFRVEPRLVRGLDYYTHTTFEFQSRALDAAQNTIGGGGRYDGLVESLGGPATPAVGFGSGIERVLLSCDAEAVFPPASRDVDVFVVDVTGGDRARDLTFELRRAGLSTDRAFDGRSMKAQMKAADRSGARLVLIVGEDEVAADAVTVRDLRGEGGQHRIERVALADHLRSIL
jgi:histidyl-tRNA synthetase